MEVDVRNADSLLQLGGADTIVNLAAFTEMMSAPPLYGDVNIGGRNYLRLCPQDWGV